MKKFYDVWLPVLDSFKRSYNALCIEKEIDTPEVVDWHPSGYLELTVKVDTGEILVYEFIGDRIYSLCSGRVSSTMEFRRCENEMAWRKNFSNNLKVRMRRRGVNCDRLSDMTGISRVTLGKYINGNATPSSYNMDRLSYALGCSVHELTMVR